MQDVSAIVVDIAVIDPKSKVLISDCLLAKLNGASLTGRLHTRGSCLGRLRSGHDFRPVVSQLAVARSIQIQSAYRGWRFPAFGCTNALFTSLRLLYDYFAS